MSGSVWSALWCPNIVSFSAFSVLAFSNGNSTCLFWGPFIDSLPSPASWVRASHFQFASLLKSGSKCKSRNSIPCIQAWLRSHRKCFLSGHILSINKSNSQRFQEWDISTVQTLPQSWPSSQWPLGVTSCLVNRGLLFCFFSCRSLGKD